MLLLGKCVDLAIVFSRFQVHESLVKTLSEFQSVLLLSEFLTIYYYYSHNLS